MRISDILEREGVNTGIILHKEGIFWRAYDVSAYTFVKNIQAYHPKWKYYKNVQQDVVYIGFPSSRLV